MSSPRTPWLHPLALLVLPLPAAVAVLVADGVGVGLACVAVGLAVTAARGWRVLAGTLAMTLLMGGVLWTGFAVALPAAPGAEALTWLPFRPTAANALAALRGSLRIVGIMVLLVATAAWLRWDILADTLIDRYRVPYRLVDVTGLGGRFAVLMRSDVAAARSLARLRTRGRPLRSARLLTRLTVPVLMGAFRHADELTIAMEARGFGARLTRTVHHSVPVRTRDVAVVAVVWVATVAGAVALHRLT